MDDREKQLTESIQHDFTEEELESLENWVSNNKPGIHSLDDTKVFQWFKLYMAGKSYSEISKITNSKKDLVLFISKRQDWFGKKNEYYKDISINMLQKYKEAKMESLNTMTSMVSAMNKYFGKKFDKYLKDNNEKEIESIDTKMLAQYHKITESLDKIMGELAGDSKPDDKNKTPLVNINMHGNAKIKQVDENTIEVESGEKEEVQKILASLSKVKKLREQDN